MKQELIDFLVGKNPKAVLWLGLVLFFCPALFIPIDNIYLEFCRDTFVLIGIILFTYIGLITLVRIKGKEGKREWMVNYYKNHLPNTAFAVGFLCFLDLIDLPFRSSPSSDWEYLFWFLCGLLMFAFGCILGHLQRKRIQKEVNQ